MPDRNSNSTEETEEASQSSLVGSTDSRERGKAPHTPSPAPEFLPQRLYLLFHGDPSGEMSFVILNGGFSEERKLLHL